MMEETDFIWTITDFDMCPQPSGQAIVSPCFSIDAQGSTKFSLRLYPRGSIEDTTGGTYVSLYLERHSDTVEEKFKLEVDISLINFPNEHRLKFKGTFIENKVLGQHNFIDRENLLRELSDSSETKLTLLCVIKVKEFIENYIQAFEEDEDNDINKKLAKFLGVKREEDETDYDDITADTGRLLDSGNHSDISIQVSGKEFKAHRVILESRCPSLMGKLVRLQDSNVYSLPNIEAPVFEIILKYLYTAKFCDADDASEKVLLSLKNEELSHLRSLIPKRCSSATTGINVVNINRIWDQVKLQELEMRKKTVFYLYPCEAPNWSWMKISLIKTENEIGCKYALKFKWMHTNIPIVFMQFRLQEFPRCFGGFMKKNANILAESNHLFQNENEWTTPVQSTISRLTDNCLLINIRISACNLSSSQSGYLSENTYIRENQHVVLDAYHKGITSRTAFHSSMKDSDVTLHVGSLRMPAHKAILGCRSEVFSKMFEHDTIENRTGVVNIKDIDGSTMASLLMYMYCGDIDAQLCVASAMKIYSAADRYQVAGLKEKCCRYLRDNITAETVSEVLSLAGNHNEECLKQSCYEFIASHPKIVLMNKRCLNDLMGKLDLYPEILSVLLGHISKQQKLKLKMSTSRNFWESDDFSVM